MMVYVVVFRTGLKYGTLNFLNHIPCISGPLKFFQQDPEFFFLLKLNPDSRARIPQMDLQPKVLEGLE